MILSFAKTFSNQQDARMCIASYNLERLYNSIEPYIKGGFENNDNMSDYDMFMKINLKNRDSHQYLPKNMLDMGACLFNKQQITQGSLPEIETEGYKIIDNNMVFNCNIRLGELVIDENTTIGQFAQAVVENNEDLDFEYNDQITFIYGELINNQSDRSLYTRFSAAKVILEQNNEILLSTLDVLDNIPYINGFQSNDGKLASKMDNNKIDVFMSAICFAWIHSRDDNGKLKVSTQHLTDPINADYSTEEYYRSALESFGYDENFADALPYLKPEKPNTPVINFERGYITADTGCKIYYTCAVINGREPDLSDIGDDPFNHTALYDNRYTIDGNIENYVPDMPSPIHTAIMAIAVSPSGRKSDVQTLYWNYYKATSQQEI